MIDIMVLFHMNLQEQIASLKHILDTISSPEIVDLAIALRLTPYASLELTLAQLTALGDLAAILASPQFSRLRKVTLNCWLGETSQSKTPRSFSTPVSGSSPDRSVQVSPLDIVSAYKQSVGEDLELAKDVIGHKLRDELQQLNESGKLDIQFSQWFPKPEKPSAVGTSAVAAADTTSNA